MATRIKTNPLSQFDPHSPDDALIFVRLTPNQMQVSGTYLRVRPISSSWLAAVSQQKANGCEAQEDQAAGVEIFPALGTTTIAIFKAEDSDESLPAYSRSAQALPQWRGVQALPAGPSIQS
jgi:hypothetical protein